MKVNLYYFSGTGNSLFIAKTIKEQIASEHRLVTSSSDGMEINIEILPIQQFTQGETISDQSEIVGIIYPTCFLDAPEVVKNFAKRLHVKKECYLFLYASCGETLGNALHMINKLFEKGQVKGNYEVILPDNSIIFETKKDEIPTMLETGEKIIRTHANEIYRQNVTVQSPFRPLFNLVSIGMKPLAKNGLGFNKMKVNSLTCNGCGLCEKLCPMKNIHLEEALIINSKMPVFGKNCEMCFSCLHYCPKEAIAYRRMSKKKKNFQYSHPQIHVKEMMDAQISRNHRI